MESWKSLRAGQGQGEDLARHWSGRKAGRTGRDRSNGVLAEDFELVWVSVKPNLALVR